MEKAVIVSAPAKINLHLRVYGRREDGFHDIRSIFQAISLADELVVGSLKETDSIEIEGSFDCPPEATTLYKAVIAYRRRTGERCGLSIRVKKAIPAGAGLGGGSSDAAALLRALNLLLGDRAGFLGEEELAELGASVGSDVPFFVRGAAALVEGRGEVVSPIPARADYALVVAFPDFPVSTAAAYSLLDRLRPSDADEPDLSVEELLASYASKPPEAWRFANSFETPVAAAHPAIATLIGLFASEGARFTRMSGSGSAVYGVFPDPDRAAFAAKRLFSRAPFASFVAPAAPLALIPGLHYT